MSARGSKLLAIDTYTSGIKKMNVSSFTIFNTTNKNNNMTKHSKKNLHNSTIISKEKTSKESAKIKS